MERKRIFFSDWLDRLDMLLIVAYGRRSNSFQGVCWEKLYEAGCSPGQVFEAIVEELAAEEAPAQV